MTLRGVFVAGTDTGVGKTWVSAALIRALREAGLAAAGMKPVASGCEDTPAGLRNADAEALRAACGDAAPPYDTVNPYALRLPMAPHLAAQIEHRVIQLGPILAAYDVLADAHRPVVVEGVGGWAVPLTDKLMQANLVQALDLPVLLVVGVRLGCINHALLSAQAIEHDRCRWLGWVANIVDPDTLHIDLVLDTLRARLGAPLAQVSYGSNAQEAQRECARAVLFAALRARTT
jgi:dethiobiotin synthetase